MSLLKKKKNDSVAGFGGRRWIGVDAARSRTMSAVRHGGTRPELEVRAVLRSLGYRFQTLVQDLPGTPDIVFKGRRAAIFVHGCYWHGHSCAHGKRQSRTNKQYWESKISRNRVRDRRNVRALRNGGWRVLVIWECQLGRPGWIREKIRKFLGVEKKRH